jgi:hypothetical protein
MNTPGSSEDISRSAALELGDPTFGGVVNRKHGSNVDVLPGRLIVTPGRPLNRVPTMLAKNMSASVKTLFETTSFVVGPVPGNPSGARGIRLR